MSANIVLSLSSTKLEVAPGESVEATITIRNQSQVVDQFDIRIEGLDPAWWTLSTSSVSLFPGDQGEAKLSIHPPKEAEVKAGSYSFQVRAVSQANPEEMTEEEAYLILRGFLVWDVEMSPTKVAGRSGTYRITASNSGNTDITLIFEGKDPEEALDYTFSHDKVTVPAGESALITLKVRPRKGEKDKLYSFQVLVRPAGAKVSSKEVRTINGKLEYKRRRWPWKWILLGLAIVAVAILVWKFILQLPVINSFAAAPAIITADDIIADGESMLSWDVSGAYKVTINPDIGPDIGSVNSTGTCKVSPDTTTTYTLEASNVVGRTSRATVTVTLPPVIISFGAEPATIRENQKTTLSWSVSGATTVTIDQDIGPVGLTEGTREETPGKTTTYTLTATNKAGIVTDEVTVTVPVPVIHYFKANPAVLFCSGGECGTSELSWSVTGASQVTIDPNVGTFDPAGETTVDTSTSGFRYTLRASNYYGTSTAEFTILGILPPSIDFVVP